MGGEGGVGERVGMGGEVVGFAVSSVTTEISAPKHFKVEIKSQDIALFAPSGRICAAAR
jgi:hypothetical protein